MLLNSSRVKEDNKSEGEKQTYSLDFLENVIKLMF